MALMIKMPQGDEKMRNFIRREAVFCVALVLSLATAIVNPPSAAWLEAMDWKTLGTLFCLMGVSEGLKDSGIFAAASRALAHRAKDTRRLSFLMVAIVFFSSMLFTNDVALLMFVPFSLAMLQERMDEKGLASLIVLETVAANLGSMTTPVGNPQNLFIVSHYNLSAASFFATILPYSLASAILLLVSTTLMMARGTTVEADEAAENRPIKGRQATIWLIFLLAALLSVFRILDWRLLFAIEALYMLIFERKTLRRIDYILLLTFVCFFIFSANLRAIPALVGFLTGAMATSPVATSALVSQVISNVPAAILLSPFTADFTGPLVGTNIGGLGTPVASLASLISLKFFFARKEGRKGLYLAIFTVVNFVFLALLSLLVPLLQLLQTAQH